MDWEKYWNKTAAESSELLQVGRLNANQSLAIQQAGNRIIELLELKPLDSILDVCCGNGLITSYIANKGYQISGIDLSANLIEQAKKNYPAIHFEKQDATSIQMSAKFNKIFIAFSFQYFDSYEKGKKVIEQLLSISAPDCTMVFTDIPDKGRWSKYYDSFLKKFFFYKQKLTGKQSMGKFWSVQELSKICESLDLQGELIIQPGDLPYSYYRFDYRLRRKN